MADIKISELGAASAVNATDLFPMTSNGVTVKATAQQIKNYMGVGNLTDLNTTDKSSTVAAINEVNTKLSKTEVLTTNIQQSIAPIQTTLVASKAYAVGEQFVYNGLLHKATAPIPQGGTITSGNCTLADNVTEQIGKLNTQLSDIKLVYGNWQSTGSGVTASENGQLYVAGLAPADSIGIERLSIGGKYTSIVVPASASSGLFVDVKKGEAWTYIDGNLSNLTWQFRTVTIE